jgi:Fe-S oxidoreductase
VVRASKPEGAARPEVLLLVDTFNRYFEPENAEAAERVLSRAGYRVTTPEPAVGRPLCCGRTFLAAGLVDEAKAEARRTIAALKQAVASGTPIIGLEPSCLLTLRDEYPALLPGEDTKALAAHVQLFEEFIETERKAGRFQLALTPMPGKTALLHGHCHQKAFGTAGAAADALKLIPEVKVETFDSTCCGMAGAFGYEAEHHDMSLKIGELGVLPKMRAAAPDTLLAACGTSCRHQIADGAHREARHIVRILDEASRPSR